jgi:hypothetical protein
VGSAAGAVVFVGLAALPSVAPGVGAWLEPLTRYPALVALPLGWVAARALSDGAPEGAEAPPVTR